MKKLLGFIVIVFGLVFIYAPIIILAVYSFLDTPNIGAAGNFTLDNYITLFTTEELSQMIWGTVILALVSHRNILFKTQDPGFCKYGQSGTCG